MPNRPDPPFAGLPAAVDIAQYFLEKTDHRNPDCDGIDLYRDGRDYCYTWVESMIDHDLWVSYLLDVRTHLAGQETREYLFVHAGIGRTFDVAWHGRPVTFDAPAADHRARTRDALHWFVTKSLAAVTDDPTDDPTAEPDGPHEQVHEQWAVDMGFALSRVSDQEAARAWVQSYRDHPEALDPGDPMPTAVRRTVTTTPWAPA